MRWEYLVVDQDPGWEDPVDFDGMGREGWELVSVSQRPISAIYTMLFKREVKEESQNWDDSFP